jgi:predicted nucleic acid-binding protein
MRFLNSLRGSPRLMRVHSDTKLDTLAEGILEDYTDRDFSYTDAVSFVVMQGRGIDEAFASDSHFVTMGYRMLPPEGGL